MACERTSETLTNSRQGTMEKLVDGQDVLPFQPTGSGKFESFASGVSECQSTKTKHWAPETKRNSQSKCIIFFEDSDSSLWQSRANFFFSKTS